MTVTLVSEPDFTLLPALCKCQANERHMCQTDSFADFCRTHNTEDSDFVYLKCPVCGNMAIPVTNKQELLESYDIWVVSSSH